RRAILMAIRIGGLLRGDSDSSPYLHSLREGSSGLESKNGAHTVENKREVSSPDSPDEIGTSWDEKRFSQESGLESKSSLCPRCRVSMGIQARLDGGSDYLCPGCGKSQPVENKNGVQHGSIESQWKRIKAEHAARRGKPLN